MKLNTGYDFEIKTALQESDANYVVWYTGSREQAEYISFYSKYLKNNSLLLPLPDSAMKGHSTVIPQGLLDYFFLDFPDVIISKKQDMNRLPIIGIEILEQKPVGWNHTQRFARSVASAISGVPFAYLMPQKRYMFDKIVSGNTSQKTYLISGEKYKENLREEFQLPFSLFKLSQIYKIPCLPFIWPVSDRNKFVSEGLVYNDDPKLRWKQLPPGPKGKDGQVFSEMEDLFSFIDMSIEYYNNDKSITEMMNEQLIKRNLEKIAPSSTKLYTKKHVSLKIPDGGNVKTAYIIDTREYIRKLEGTKGKYIKRVLNSNEFEVFRKKKKTVVIEISSNPLKGNRGFADPYSGVCASFDVRYCRNDTQSREKYNRDYNLVFSPQNKKSSEFFMKIIKEEIGDGYPLNAEERLKIEDTIIITKKLFENGPFKLKKEIKNIFYFCDLIVTPDNLFVGKSFLEPKS